MSSSHCPYCHSVKSILLGNVYCSLHGKAMGELSTGTFSLRSTILEETHEHVSRLSIRCSLNGEQRYKVGGNDFLVTPKNFLLVNQGQHYKTSFESETAQEMMLVAFQPGFAEGLYYSLNTQGDALLDNPFSTNSGKVEFFEKTYDMDPTVLQIFGQLKKIIDSGSAVSFDDELDHIYTDLLSRLFFLHSSLRSEINRLKGDKLSTRTELFRRLSVAKDYMHANVSQKVRLDDVATAACLSVHHFKREFARLYGVSPHRYLTMQRMNKAKGMLSTGFLTIEDISIASGFESTSSFIRQFKSINGHTPGNYRRVAAIS